MKKVLIETPVYSETIYLKDVMEVEPIFAKRDGKIVGMVIHEKNLGWIVKIGYDFGATGYHATRENCLKSCLVHGYEFFVETQ